MTVTFYSPASAESPWPCDVCGERCVYRVLIDFERRGRWGISHSVRKVRDLCARHVSKYKCWVDYPAAEIEQLARGKS